MEISPVEYHFQFLAWFSKAYPELHAQYADHFILHLIKPVIGFREQGLDEASIIRLEQIVREFNDQIT